VNVKDLIAIDVHTHADVSCRQPPDEVWQAYEDAASKYFKAGKRPTITDTIAYYRERKIGLVMFTVDAEHEIGAKRIPNEEVRDAARANSDLMIAFASIDPHKGKMGVREARRLIAEGSCTTCAESRLRSTLPSAVVPGNAASMAGAASPSYRM